LRAVAYLGAAAEMQSTGAGAGPHIPTPGAQMQRQLTYDLALLPHAGDWAQAEVWRQAQAFNHPPRAAPAGMARRPGKPPGTDRARRSFLSLSGPNVVLSSLKKADEGDALILRLFNAADTPSQARLQLPFAPARVELANLHEQALPPGALQIEADGTLQVTLA